MGSLCTKLQPRRILIVGLEVAGKTTFLYRLKSGTIQPTVPTRGFNVESLNSYPTANKLPENFTVDDLINFKKDAKHESDFPDLTFWDFGGSFELNPLWINTKYDCILFLIDGSRPETLLEVRSIVFSQLHSNVPMNHFFPLTDRQRKR